MAFGRFAGLWICKIGKDGRERLEAMIQSYISQRKQLINLFVLIDSRHEPQKIDLDL